MSVSLTLFLYNLGCAEPIQLYEEERHWLENFIHINGLKVDPDSERYAHVGISMEPKIDKHNWTTYEISRNTEYQILFPMLDGNKMLMPTSMFKGCVEGDVISINMPCLLRHRACLADLGIAAAPIDGYIEIKVKLDQMNSQFKEMGPFEDALSKVL